MAKKRFKIRDKQGNPVDYDISAASVTIDVEGKSLEVKLSELVDAIARSVKSVTFNGNSPTMDSNGNVNLGQQVQGDWTEANINWPSFIRNKPSFSRVATTGSYNDLTDKPTTPEGVQADSQMSDSSDAPVKNRVIKAYVDNLISGLINGAPQALDTLNELSAALGNDANFAATITQQLAGKISGIKKHDGTPLIPQNGIVTLPEQTEGEEVSVTTNEDGTFTIHVGETDYTINLNHTHENMAKIVKCTEATLPQTLENGTIYVQVDNATTPTDIESLWLFGLEFTGGGVPAGTPRLTSPKATVPIDLGQTASGTASTSVTIKGKDLTQSLVVEFGSGSTGYSFDTSDLPTGVTYDSVEGTLTITKEAACAINGVDIVVVYTGNDTDENAEGTLDISSVSADGISVEVALITNKVTIEELAAVKLNGTQWMKTDYYPNPKTEFDLVLKFDSNSNTNSGSSAGNAFLRCFPDGSGYFYAMVTSGNDKNIEMLNQIDGAHLINVASGITQDQSVFSYKILTSDCSFSFIPGGTGTGYTHSTLAKKTNTETNPLAIGLNERQNPSENKIFNRYDMTIYRFTIYEDGVAVRDFVPRKKNGVTGLLDVAENGSGVFLSSGSSSELVPVPLTQSNS